MPSPSSGPADALVGRSIDDIETPALVLDLDAFDRNAARLHATIAAGGKAWRPHAKGHKSTWLARRQLEIGAHGVTCAKVGEAEVMVAAGIPSVLVANEIATVGKLERVARLQRTAEVIVCADDPAHVRLASHAAVKEGTVIPMLVDIDTGMHRTGIAPGRPAADLAVLIDGSPGLRFAGLMGYEGHVLTDWPAEVKRRSTEQAVAGLLETRRLLELDGLEVPIISGAGSGNHVDASALDGFTELQAGGACLMDRFYGEDCHLEEQGFEHAVFVVATVTSHASPDRAIMDAGFKTLSFGETPPLVRSRPDIVVSSLSAEHGELRGVDGAIDVAIGDRLTLIPNYHDTTTFLHDAFIGLRDGRVDRVIPLDARGRLT